MIKKSLRPLTLISLIAVSCGLSFGQGPEPPKTHLKIGDAAPAFTLVDQNGARVSLSDFKGKKNVVLAFYVLAFTGG